MPRLSSFLAVVGMLALAATQVQAADFRCVGIEIRQQNAAGGFDPVPLAEAAALTLRLDPGAPERSSLSWSGDPQMEGRTNSLTPESRVGSADGATFATLYVSGSAGTAVGTIAISRDGWMWITESALAEGKFVHFVTTGRCTAAPRP